MCTCCLHLPVILLNCLIHLRFKNIFYVLPFLIPSLPRSSFCRYNHHVPESISRYSVTCTLAHHYFDVLWVSLKSSSLCVSYVSPAPQDTAFAEYSIEQSSSRRVSGSSSLCLMDQGPGLKVWIEALGCSAREIFLWRVSRTDQPALSWLSWQNYTSWYCSAWICWK